MIIERKFVKFGILCERDPKAKEIFMKAFNESYREEVKEEMWANLYYQCLYERDMAWCFGKIADVIDGFELLDKSEPYDNGLTFDDITSVEIAEKEEDFLILNLLNIFYGEKQIVKRIKIDNKEY